MTEKEEAVIREGREALIRSLESFRAKNKIRSEAQLAEKLGVAKSRMGAWLRGGELPKERTFDKKLVPLLRLSAADLNLIRKAFAVREAVAFKRQCETKRRGTPVPMKTMTPKAPVVSETPLRDVLARLAQLEETVSRLSVLDRQTEESYAKLMASRDDPRWNVQGMRFVLNARNFTLLPGSPWTEREVEDTGKLAAELRRRLVILAQLKNNFVREEVLEHLGRELDELWNTFQIARSVVPMQAVNVIDLEREGLKFPTPGSSSKGISKP